MRTFRSSTNTTTRRVTVADRTGWTACNWYTGGVIMGTTRGSGARRPRLEPDDEQSRLKSVTVEQAQEAGGLDQKVSGSDRQMAPLATVTPTPAGRKGAATPVATPPRATG